MTDVEMAKFVVIAWAAWTVYLVVKLDALKNRFRDYAEWNERRVRRLRKRLREKA